MSYNARRHELLTTLCRRPFMALNLLATYDLGRGLNPRGLEHKVEDPDDGYGDLGLGVGE